LQKAAAVPPFFYFFCPYLIIERKKALLLRLFRGILCTVRVGFLVEWGFAPLFLFGFFEKVKFCLHRFGGNNLWQK
ncbi:MAG: hypothetical protein RR828_02120, partial [Oscillospiraceae bacterium]